MSIVKINSLGITYPVSFSAGTASLPSITFSGDTNTGVFSPTADTIAFTEGGAEAMRIDSSGNVGIGTTSPANKLDVNSTAKVVDFLVNTNTTNPGQNNSTVGMFFNSAGRFFINNQSGDNILGRNTDGTLLSIRRNGTEVGSISVTSSATAYNTSSDYRLKENVNYNFDATTRLKQLKPARFNFIAEPNKTVDGFLAHEVQEIIPEAIVGTKDEIDSEGKPVYQGIDQSKLTPILTKALQEAIAKIEQLEARLTALESK